MLVLLGNLEIREDENEDEDVVHRERVLDEITGEKFESGLFPHHVVNAGGKGEREHHPHDAPGRGGLYGSRVRFLVKDYEIEKEYGENDGVEADPSPHVSHRRWRRRLCYLRSRASRTSRRISK